MAAHCVHADISRQNVIIDLHRKSIIPVSRSPGHRTCKEAVIRYSSLSGSLRLPLAGATCESYETGHKHAINILGGIHEGFDPTGKIAVLHVMLEKMRNRLKTLEPRQQRILMVHFGLNFMEWKTISETAAYYHLTENSFWKLKRMH